MTERTIHWIIKHPVITTILLIASTLALASGGQHLSFSNDYRLFFSESNPQLQAFEELQTTYTKSDNVTIVIAPKDKDIFTRETLAAVEALTEAAWKTPYSTRVDSLTNFQHSYAEEDDLIVEDFVTDAEELSDSDLQSLRNTALTEPLIVNKVISKKGDVTGVNISVFLPDDESHLATPKVLQHIENLVSEFEAKYPDIEFHITGIVALNNALQYYSEADIKTLIPITLAFVILGLTFLLKSSVGTICTLIIVSTSVVAAMGVAGWSGIVLTPSSVGAPTIIATLAIADCVHILTNYMFARSNGESKSNALLESLRLNISPILLTSITTIIGLLAMNFSDAPPLRDLGNIAAIGVAMAFIFSVTLLPALIMLMPDRRPQKESAEYNHAMNSIAMFVLNHHTALLIGMTTLIIFVSAFISQNQLNDEFHKFFDEDTQIRQSTDFTNDNLTGIYEIHYALNSGEANGVSKPDFLRTLDEFAQWYMRQPNVVHVYSIADIMKRLNKNMHNDEEHWYTLPDQSNLSAQYLLVYEMSLPFGLDLNDRINLDKSATRLTVTLNNLTSSELLAIEQSAQQWLKEHAPESMWTQGASAPIMFAHIGARNIHSTLVGIVIALALISIILIFALRSFKIGLISLIPNLAPIAMAFGCWGMLVGQIGFAMSTVASMSLGIIVDDTIHFLSKYLHARREKFMSPEEAIRYAFLTVGRALWTTSFVLIAGFLVLAFSDFQFNSGTGILMAITIGCALLADFFFLPPLLLLLEKHFKSQPNNTTTR